MFKMHMEDVIRAVMIKLRCPSCQGDDVKSDDKMRQLYVCNKSGCSSVKFRLDYVYEADVAAESADQTADVIQCPSCDGDEVRKFGKRQGKQIYRCNNDDCGRTTFRQEYDYKACDPRVKSHIADLKADGVGARAIGRMLSVSKDTVTKYADKIEGEESDE